MKVLFLGFASLALALALGCKPKARGGDSNTASANAQFPTLASTAGDATALTKIGIFGKGGANKIVVDLTRTPAPNGAPWACWAIPADSTPIGRATCMDDPSKGIDVVAANVEFSCTANPDWQVTKAKAPLSQDFCEAYNISEYAYTPALAVTMND